jgi:GAF domain-containing protein
VENGIMSEGKHKPVPDEQTLGKLLEAAYILQEHNREMREFELPTELKRDQVEADASPASKKAPKSSSSKSRQGGDYTLTLAQIVETQHDIQVRQLSLQDAMSLVAERVIEIAGADGVAIGMAEGTNVRYRAIAGVMTPAKDAIVPIEKSLCSPCVKTNQVLRCSDAKTDPLVDTEECRRRGIASMIAVPVFRDGSVVGGLELYYSTQNAFTDQDVHTCQLMAGLITEGLARNEEITWKKSLADERAAMLEALEKLKPNLAALLGQSADSTAAAAVSETTPPTSVDHACRKCGHKIVGDEQFCGQCGSPRSSDYEPPNMQSKVASLWHMQEARKKDVPLERIDLESSDEDGPEEFQEELRRLLSNASFPDTDETLPSKASEPSHPGLNGAEPEMLPELLNTELENSFEESTEESADASQESISAEPMALEKTSPRPNWSSAASARAFLEQLASANRAPSLIRFWNSRRGDIYLAVAIILVFCVIRWGIWSGHSVSATGTNAAAAAHHKSPEPQLSLFDRVLIQLGIADPPDSPEDKGNPSAQVWIDTHSALYYCAGADLYGKTPKGKFATQREAQLDQFQPAYRKACN